MDHLRLVCALFFLNSVVFSQTSISTWKRSVKVDGEATEWNKPLRFYDAETKLFFSFANDSSNLYLCFQSNDKRNQVKIHMAGMKVFVNTKGKEKHKACISYPLTDSKVNFAREELNEETEPNIDLLKNQFMLQNTNMLLSGFAAQNGTFPLSDSTGIHAALNWNEKNIMTYELAIPLKELFGPNYTAKDLESVVALIIEVNAVTREDSSIDASQTAMGSATGSQTAGMTRNLPSTSSKEKRPLFDKNKCKQKFKLAVSPNVPRSTK
jgi:hypothetical protein